MKLSTIREQVRAQVSGESASDDSLANLSKSERAAIRAMVRRASQVGANTSEENPTSAWWF